MSEVETLPTPKKPPSDSKDYKLIKLQNGLKAILSTHPKLKKNSEDKSEMVEKSSAVALCTDFGSFDDPKEVQGLSHFIEHLVRLENVKRF